MHGRLPFAAFDIPVRVQSNILYRAAFADDLAAFAPGLRSVPALKTPQGGLLTDSIAIAWHLAEAFPDSGLLPLEPAQRAMAQSLIAEMHSGFGALRSVCPMNPRNAGAGFTPSAAVLADLARIEAIWVTARDRDCRHRAASFADGGRAGVWEIHAGRAPARYLARAFRTRGA